MTLLTVLNRALMFAAILAVTPLLFPNNIYSQKNCRSKWDGFKRETVPCPKSTPDPEPVYIAPTAEEIRLTQAREQNDLGIKAQNNGNWGIAAYHFERARAKDPNSAQYLANLNNAKRQIEIDANRRLQQSLQDARKNQVDARGKGGLIPIGSGDVFGLRRSNPTHSDLRPLDQRIDRNFGEHPVWGQLNCAVDLTRKAMSAAPSPGEERSFAESRNLLGEALNALNGNPNGVPCLMGGPLPRVSGRTPDLSRAVKKGRDLIERARVAIDEREEAGPPVSEEERIAIAHAKSKANEEAIAKQTAESLKRPPKKLSPDQIVVPSPTTPPKPKAKPKSEFEKIGEEALGLISFPLAKLKPRRGATPQPPTPR